jgi:acetyl esterase/lipase
MCKYMEQRSWVNWKETAEKVDVQVVEANAENNLQLECYVIKPKNYIGDGPMACMVYAHGGGGVVCEPLDMICTFRYVALLWNCCIIMPKYRLAPEAKYPLG